MKAFVCRIVFSCINFLLVFSGPCQGQGVSPECTLKVVPDQAAWQYHTGQPVIFHISGTINNKMATLMAVHVTIGPEKMPPFIDKDTVLKNGSLQINGGSLQAPGFLRCTVTALNNKKTYRALATAAVAPDEIRPTESKPRDFDTFWRRSIDAAKKIAMDSRLRLIPERCNDKIDVYEISVQNFRSGSRIYGILCQPKKPGKYPAVLKLPGAGVRAYKGDTALAERGVVTLEIGIHGIPVTMPNEVYYNLAFGPLNDYYFFGLDNRDAYYYKRVFLGCIRALDFLSSLPQVDTSRLAVYGGSQGGALSIVTAALDHRVKFIAALYPALSDLTGYFHGRAGGWPHMFAPSAPSSLKSPEKIATAAYYDVANFASELKIPGIYSWGYNDEVCPPTCTYAVYNTISAPKEKFITRESGHWLTPEQDAKLTAWLLQKLGVR